MAFDWGSLGIGTGLGALLTEAVRQISSLLTEWHKHRNELRKQRELQRIRREDEDRETTRKIAEEQRASARLAQEKADSRREGLEDRCDKFLRARLDCMKEQSFNNFAFAVERLGAFLYNNPDFLSVPENQLLFTTYCSSSVLNEVRTFKADDREKWRENFAEQLHKAKPPKM